MSAKNKLIAIKWATDSVKNCPSFVYSDQFFKPFSNPSTQKKISAELDKLNVVVWSDTKGGAFLFRKNDKRLTVVAHGQFKSGTWIENSNVMILPLIATI